MGRRRRIISIPEDDMDAQVPIALAAMEHLVLIGYGNGKFFFSDEGDDDRLCCFSMALVKHTFEDFPYQGVITARRAD